MALNSLHPEYVKLAREWIKLRDCYRGEEAVKAKRVEYLPETSGMVLDGMTGPNGLGYKAYNAYLLRAVWHDLFKEGVEAYIGMLNTKPATFELPKSMEFMRETASSKGESLNQLLRRIHEEQLVTGRLGLLADLPARATLGAPQPYISFYPAESVLNWDDGEELGQQTNLNFVVLDESGYSRTNDEFNWQLQTRYRVCQLGSIALEGAVDPNQIYSTGLFRVQGQGVPLFDPLAMIVPTIRGTPMNKIPFVFINSKDLLANPDVPPLLGLGNIMFAIYRGEADYRQNLFMQGQDTLVTIGELSTKDVTDVDVPLRTGAGSRIAVDVGGDAKYVGVNSQGLSEQRQALQNDRSRAEVRAGQLINVRSGDKESGDALKTRLAAQTATLMQIALTAGKAIEMILRDVAVWMGENPESVKVTANTEFGSKILAGQDAQLMMEAKDLGLPISYESIHEWLVDTGVSKLSFPDEVARITKERAMVELFKDPVAQAQKQKELDNADPANKPPPAPPKPPAAN